MTKKSKSKRTVEKKEDIIRIFNVSDRLILGSLLPKESSIIEMILVKSIKEKIVFSQEELDKLDIRKVGIDSIVCNENVVRDKKISFTEAESELMKSHINMLDSQKKISSDQLSICLKLKE